MKTILSNIKNISLTLLFLTVLSCETMDTDLIDNPSQLNPEDASVEFLFNSTQLSFGRFFYNIHFPAAQVTRMEAMRFSPFYESQFQAQNFDGIWTLAYSNFLNDLKLLKELSAIIDEENPDNNMNNQLAVAQIMEAYVISALVDYFGDIPYTEALQGAENFNPVRDNQRDVYNDAISLLENAIALIDQGGSFPLVSDIYYGGQMDNWKRLAGSLLIKLSINSRLNDAEAGVRINNIIASGNYIMSNAQDFQFNFTESQANPDSRHPLFSAQYDAAATVYMSKDYIERMMKKDINDPNDPYTPSNPYDPRFRYYFYLQNGTITLARAHGDAGPPVASDFNAMPVHGLYPIGGKYNDGTTGATNRNMGAVGQGAHIILTNSFTQFLIAEAELMVNGNVGGARNALQNGISASMQKVTNFRTFGIPSGADVPTQDDINNYIAEALARYDNASGSQAKLNVIITEYYKALFGNGLEVYNNFRRTGYPIDLPPSITSNPGVFTHSMLYPFVHINNNSNASQKASIGEKIWWAEGTTFNLDF